jgi:hypothetical protein
MRWDDTLAKFGRLTAGVVSDKDRDRIVGLIAEFERDRARDLASAPARVQFIAGLPSVRAQLAVRIVVPAAPL